jgi:hypothetical protein
MLEQEITPILTTLYDERLQTIEPGIWQVETPTYRLLVLLSKEKSWVRMMIPIASVTDAEPFWRELLENNFEDTGEARYSLYEDVLWVVFQHRLRTLTEEDFRAAIACLIGLQERGLNDSFNRYVDQQISMIIGAAKQQGMSLAATLQNLDRFYQEGVMGDLNASADVRNATLAAWRDRLERLWPTIDGHPATL